ncbi:uridine 5'-monophosphate synthase isoform X3 [Trichomycterus rosablanca]|uniref:uridine 5'-monophosphate synthase isoform X3 n=1 Tax=Trichomycterus rosablanca TaxID=2290929 RepID=UPI002F356D83
MLEFSLTACVEFLIRLYRSLPSSAPPTSTPCSSGEKRPRTTALQRVVKSAQRTIGCSLPPIGDIYTTRCKERAACIFRDPTHPAHGLFTPLPSGTKRLIEGSFRPGDVCLIVEDVVTSGGSVMETSQELQAQGLKVKDAVVLLDRAQGGTERLRGEGISLHPVISVSKLLDVLVGSGRIDRETFSSVEKFIRENQTFSAGQKDEEKNGAADLSYSSRAALPSTHPLAKRLFSLMEEKRTNLCVSADVTTTPELLEIADALGPLMCVLKTHVDVLQDFSMDTVDKLEQLSDKHNFLIFEDRKFADIGNTVKHQYQGGVYQISSWAHIINAHAVPGPSVVEGLKAVGQSLGRGCLLIAQMSSKGALATDQYTHATVKMAEDHPDFVFGFISGSKVSSKAEHVHMTPGVQMQSGGDELGQQYTTPDQVIRSKRSDIIIVGRGILSAPDRRRAAEEYRKAGWDAYLSRISPSQ